MGKLLALATGFVGLIAIVMLVSLLFIKLGWTLFIVPVFGLPDLTWVQALGFSFLAGAFKTSSIKNNKD